MTIRFPAVCLSILLAASAARAAFTIPGFELVCTLPVDTTLDPKDLRQAHEVWPEMFAGARKSIDIEQFYITPKDGEPLDAALAELAKAGERGVKIRFLLEKKFEKNSLEGIERLKKIPNLELRMLEWGRMAGEGIIHAKFMVVDGKEAYVGSQNFDWRSLKHIHEMGLKVTEPQVAKDIAAVFDADWAAQAKIAAGAKVPVLNKTRPAAPAGKRAYLVASPYAFNPPGVGDSESELSRLLGTAQKEAAVQVLDYAPLTYAGPGGKRRFYAPIDNAIRDAAVRGVKVKLLVSHWNTDKPAIEHLKGLSLVPNVEIRIATIPEAKEGFVPFARVNHSKFMVIDGKTLWLGTSNWTGGYLDNSRNLEIVVNDEALAARALAVHSQLWDSQYSAPIDVAKDYPKPRKG